MCPSCEKEFVSKYNLKRHMEQKHDTLPPEQENVESEDADEESEEENSDSDNGEEEEEDDEDGNHESNQSSDDQNDTYTHAEVQAIIRYILRS